MSGYTRKTLGGTNIDMDGKVEFSVSPGLMKHLKAELTARGEWFCEAQPDPDYPSEPGFMDIIVEDAECNDLLICLMEEY